MNGNGVARHVCSVIYFISALKFQKYHSFFSGRHYKNPNFELKTTP